MEKLLTFLFRPDVKKLTSFVNVVWVLDCISNFKILEKDEYVVEID